MAYTPAGIVLEGFPFGIFTFTYALSGVAASDTAVEAVRHRAVSLDTAADGTVKLAGNGDKIFGRIFGAENRAVLGLRVAAVERKFKNRLPLAAGNPSGVARGDRLVGAGDGFVKKDAAADPTNPIVLVVDGDTVIAEYL
jgi:hypothetical protein